MLSKTFILLLLALSVLWGILGVAVQSYYYHSLPKAPDSRSGQDTQMVVSHGSVRFGTKTQDFTLRLLQNGLPVAGLSFAIALLLGLKFGVLRVRSGGASSSDSPESLGGRRGR